MFPISCLIKLQKEIMDNFDFMHLDHMSNSRLTGQTPAGDFHPTRHKTKYIYFTLISHP